MRCQWLIKREAMAEIHKERNFYAQTLAKLMAKTDGKLLWQNRCETKGNRVQLYKTNNKEFMTLK